jgi:hypothetical protein
MRGKDIEEGDNSHHGDKGEEVAEPLVLSKLANNYFPPFFLSFYLLWFLLSAAGLGLLMWCIQFYLIRLASICDKDFDRNIRSIESGLPALDQVHHLEEDLLKILPMLQTDEGYYLHDMF